MVAVAGRGWRLAPSLVALVNECDRRAPGRSTASDGSIGDLRHTTLRSDHNPTAGFVCAVDITDDKPECDADQLARHIIARRDKRVKYVIYNRTIVQAAKGWRPEPYSGSNPHDRHTHVSIFNTPAARNDLSPWWPVAAPAPKPDPDPPTATIALENDMDTLIKGNSSPTWYAASAIHKRPLQANGTETVQEQVNQLLFAGLLRADGNQPFVLAQPTVNELRTV